MGDTPSLNAQELFVNKIIRRARNGVLEDLREELEQGPSGRMPDPAMIVRHEWFQTLDDEAKDQVLQVASEAVDGALFGAMVILDRMSGGYAISDEPSDFALYLQTYDNEDLLWENSPASKIRINDELSGEYLHDLYNWAVEESERVSREEKE